MAKKNQSRKHVLKEETRKEIRCESLGFSYISKSKKKWSIEILKKPECQAELDKLCGSTVTEFRELFAGIGTHITAASIAAVAVEILTGGVK